MKIINIELLANKSLEQIKQNYDNFPKEGFLAGGSLANLIWEYVSGNKAVINDIDIFKFDGTIEKDIVYNGSTSTRDGDKLFYNQSEKKFFQDYTGFCQTIHSKEFYLISGAHNDGIYNYISYKGTTDNIDLILQSFDLNCTQIGYDIKNDKFYWTESFEEFLQTGELKFTNLNSPHHSAIRILKKRDELSAKLDPEEFKLCVYTIVRNLNGITRRYFTEKYAKIFLKYKSELENWFVLRRDDMIPELIKKKKNVDLKIFTLEPNSYIDRESIFPDLSNISGIWRVEDFLIFKRHIEKSQQATIVWQKVNYLFSKLGPKYLDEVPNLEDLELLYRVTYNTANIINNIENLTISQQIELIRKLLNKFDSDISVALAILEKNKFDSTEIDLDDDSSLLLELSVRKEIVNNKYKIEEILGTKPTNKTDKNTRIDLDLDF
jgi:hypothetical protein